MVEEWSAYALITSPKIGRFAQKSAGCREPRRCSLWAEGRLSQFDVICQVESESTQLFVSFGWLRDFFFVALPQ